MRIWRFISITINLGSLHPQPTSYFKNSSLMNLLNSQSIHSMASSQASLLLQKQLKDLNKHPVEGFSAGLLNENNVFEWSVLIMGPPGTLYEGGFFSAIMSFPSNYPCNPPTLKFTSEIWHPNIYPDGKVCISILHPPGDDPNGYEVAAERWSAVHTVESIILSVIVMLSDPNVESPANIDAAKEWRENREVFKKKAARCARKSEDLFLSL
ncbi:ubiquitin-conjugating enzyme E2 13-like isoform X3 [Pistacia vera]|uniref:ubiquitin-conjugating enzyme E2 13-like isoform X3 n=1 Tax=Pistacia vera TaxID=55513 RepID=UPI0012634AD2|nr:ubiquitin-conjugating enzyme E2 13-like isoform X3 [Pistacia vera]